MELLRLVLEHLCPSVRRKLGQLRFWVLSQHIGEELYGGGCLMAGEARKLFLVPCR